MNYLLILTGCIVALTAAAEEPYRPPVKLSAQEAQATVQILAQQRTQIKNRRQTRLAVAKQNQQKMAAAGANLSRPYYGDFAGQNNGHAH